MLKSKLAGGYAVMSGSRLSGQSITRLPASNATLLRNKFALFYVKLTFFDYLPLVMIVLAQRTLAGCRFFTERNYVTHGKSTVGCGCLALNNEIMVH